MRNPQIEIKPSLILMGGLLFSHLGATVCVLFLGAPLAIKLLLVGLCTFSLCCSLWRHVLLRSAKSVVKVQQETNSSWKLWQSNGDIHCAELRGDSIVTRWFILLNFTSGRWFVRSVLLFNDTMTVDEFRRLRVALSKY